MVLFLVKLLIFIHVCGSQNPFSPVSLYSDVTQPYLASFLANNHSSLSSECEIFLQEYLFNLLTRFGGWGSQSLLWLRFTCSSTILRIFMMLHTDEYGKNISDANGKKRNPNMYVLVYKFWQFFLLRLYFLSSLHGMIVYTAVATIPSGILYGNFVNLGRFDDCLGISVETNHGNISGKYCLGSETRNEEDIYNLIMEKYLLHDVFPANKRRIDNKGTTFRWGVCFPSACKAEEVEDLFRYLFSNITLAEEFCVTKESEITWTNSEKTVLILLILWILIVSLSTLCDVFYSSVFMVNVPTLQTFSICYNWKKLFYEERTDRLKCIDGIGVTALFFFILGNRFLLFIRIPELHDLNYQQWVASPWTLEIVGSNLNTDTFLLLGGLVTIYNFLKKMETQKDISLLTHICKQYFRFTIPLGASIIVQNLLLDKVIQGPLMSVLHGNSVTACNTNWWKSILYVQNYLNPNNLCLTHTWYLDVHFQLYILSIIALLAIYFGYERSTVCSFFILIAFSTCISFLVTWENELSFAGFAITDVEEDDFFMKYYIKTHVRMVPWFSGMALGFFMYKTVQKSKIHVTKVMVVSMWIMALAAMVGCILTIRDATVQKQTYSKLQNALLASLISPVWCASLCWIIFACLHGYGGYINSIVSQPIFGVFRKVSYCIYLMHYPFLAIMLYRQRVQIVFNVLHMNYLFLGDFMCITILAIMWTLVFELPVSNITKSHNTQLLDKKLTPFNNKNNCKDKCLWKSII